MSDDVIERVLAVECPFCGANRQLACGTEWTDGDSCPVFCASRIRAALSPPTGTRAPVGERETFELRLVVNGQPTTLEVRTGEPMRSLIKPALDKTGMVGRPPEDWELRDVDGELLYHDDIIVKPFPPDTLLFLTLKAGVAAGTRAETVTCAKCGQERQGVTPATFVCRRCLGMEPATGMKPGEQCTLAASYHHALGHWFDKHLDAGWKDYGGPLERCPYIEPLTGGWLVTWDDGKETFHDEKTILGAEYRGHAPTPSVPPTCVTCHGVKRWFDEMSSTYVGCPACGAVNPPKETT